MRVLVLGAGVIGMTTAHALARKGCRVTVLDQAGSVAAGASFANGGQLSYSFVDPLASPQMIKMLPSVLLGRIPSMRLGRVVDVEMMRWGSRFLWQSRRGRSQMNLKAALKLAQESWAALQDLQEKYAISFRHRVAGKLTVTRSKQALSVLKDKTELKKAVGQNLFLLTKEECFGLSPAFDRQLKDIVGGVYAPDDAVGDARRFTEALANICTAELGVTIKLKQRVRGLVIHSGKVFGVKTNNDELLADAVVVTLGASAAPFLKQCGLYVPVMPVKGYSFSMPATDTSPALSLTDLDNRTVYAPLDNQVRVAGLADFDGNDTKLDAGRLSYLKDAAQTVMPEAGDYSHACSGWAGVRPMTPNGLPITGTSDLKNLYLNVGHGMFGWTFACGSANRLVAAMFDKTMRHGRAV